MTRRPLLALGTLACLAVAACEDIPLLPQWEADWEIPLPSQTIVLPNEFPGATVPQGTSFPVDFPAQEQSLGDALAAFSLDETLREGTEVAVTVTKPASTNLAIDATLYVGESTLALNDVEPRTIRLALAIAAAGTAASDTVLLSAAQLAMIQQLASTDGSLWVQLRGTATAGAGGHTFSSTDTLSVRAQLFARVAVSR